MSFFISFLCFFLASHSIFYFSLIFSPLFKSPLLIQAYCYSFVPLSLFPFFNDALSTPRSDLHWSRMTHWFGREMKLSYPSIRPEIALLTAITKNLSRQPSVSRDSNPSHPGYGVRVSLSLSTRLPIYVIQRLSSIIPCVSTSFSM
jgi:hypothetical protein